MKATRILALLLALIMVLAAFSGCSKADKGGSSASSGEAGVLIEDDTPPDIKTYTDHLKISYGGVQFFHEGYDYNYGDDFAKWWTSNFNIEWDVISLDFASWAERLRTWINADDLPDLSCWSYVHSEAQQYVDQGLVKKLPDDWQTRWPNLAKASAGSPANAKMTEMFDGTYYLFRPVYAVNYPADRIVAHPGVFLRQDWADKMGYALKDAMTLNEIVDFAYALKKNNPGGVNNFYPMINSPLWLTAMINWNNQNSQTYYLGDDNTYHWGGADEATYEALALLCKAYNDGLIHPEFYTINANEEMPYFDTTGEAGILAYQGVIGVLQTAQNNMSEYLGVDYWDACRFISVLGNDEHYHMAAHYNYWCAMIFNPHIEDAKLERILDMFDYGCTQYGQYFIRLGFEGVDWKYDENGKPVNLLEENVALTDKYWSVFPMYGNMFILTDDFAFVNPAYTQQLRDQLTNHFLTEASYATDETDPPAPDPNVAFHASNAMNLATLTYADEYSALIINSTPDTIRANWEKWVDEKMPLIQPVLDELNAKLG